jgi:hypothetical protein
MPETAQKEYEMLYDMMKTGPTALGFTKDGRAVVSYIVLTDGREPEFIPIGEITIPLGRTVEE